MSSQVLKATWETEIYFTVFKMFYDNSEFQYSPGSDCKSNYLQKFDNYITEVYYFFINKSNSNSYLCVLSLKPASENNFGLVFNYHGRVYLLVFDMNGA